MMKRIHERKGQEGFTLIELMIVIAVLGILAAMVIPRLQSAADTAREGNIVRTAGSIRGAMELFLVQEGDYPTEADASTYADLETQLEPYVDLPNIDEHVNSTATAATGLPAVTSGYSYQLVAPVDPSTTSTYQIRIYSRYNTDRVLLITPEDADWE